MDDPITITLAVGMTLRLVRLLATDTITTPIRNRTHGWVHTLITCGWCSSFWFGIIVACTAHQWGHTSPWRIIALALTASWVAGSLHNTGNPSRVNAEIATVSPVYVWTADDTDNEDE